MGISDDDLFSVTPKQADRFVDHLVGASGDSLDDLIIEAEWREDRWPERIRDMILLHVRRTGREPNAVWLPGRFASLVSERYTRPLSDLTQIPGVKESLHVGSVEHLPSPFRDGINPEDLAVGILPEKFWANKLRLETLFVERHCGPEIV